MDCLVGKGRVKRGINGKQPAWMCVFVRYVVFLLFVLKFYCCAMLVL